MAQCIIQVKDTSIKGACKCTRTIVQNPFDAQREGRLVKTGLMILKHHYPALIFQLRGFRVRAIRFDGEISPTAVVFSFLEWLFFVVLKKLIAKCVCESLT